MPTRKKLTFESIEEIRKAKKAPAEVVEIVIDGAGDGAQKFDWAMRGIGRKSFEDLSSRYENEDTPSGWEMDKFAPALIAACSESPKLSEEDANAIWNDDAWTTKELEALFRCALRLSSNWTR